MLHIYKFLSNINKGGVNQGERGGAELLTPKAVNFDIFYGSPYTASHMLIKNNY